MFVLVRGLLTQCPPPPMAGLYPECSMEVPMLKPVVRPASLTDLAYSQLGEGCSRADC